MSNKYQYDETGQSNFFFLTVLLLFLLPFSYSSLKPSSDSRAPPPCSGWNKKTEEVKRGNKKSFGGITRGNVLLAVGWLAFAVVVKRALEVKPDALVYDPFKILGIATSATEKEIKKHYRKMSLKFHPDKLVLAVNQTLEEANNHFVELTKAYKALTDEEIRHNFEMFGHPDGKQEFSQGIGLPSWVVEKRNVWWVMGAYTIVLGILLPFFVGKWWYGTRRFTKDGLLNASASSFFRNLKEETTFSSLLEILSSAEEFISTPSLVAIRKVSTKQKESVDEYARLVSSVREADGAKEGWEGYSSWPVEKKRTRVLLGSYLLRLPIKDSTLLKERQSLVLISTTLLPGLLSISLSHSWLSTTILILHLSQFLLQAVHPASSSPLLQLPHLTNELVEKLKAAGVESVEDFVRLEKEREEALKGVIGEGEKREAKEVAKEWPIVKFEEAKFQVVGEKIVTPGAVVNFTVRLRITPPSSSSSSSTSANGHVPEGVDVEAKESSIDELIGRRSAKDEGIVPSAVAHSPHYPSNKKPLWYIFVGDHKLNRVFVAPIKFTDMGKDVVRTVRLTFQAPMGPGLYTFQAYVMSDSFVGTDVQKDMRMKVEAPSTDLVGEEDEISEPEEDSIAGQMAMMKGQPVRKIAHGSDDEDDEDTSGSEEEDSDDDDDSDEDSD